MFIVLLSSLVVVFSDATSVTRLKNLFSKMGLGSVSNLTVSQSGKQVIVEWETPELSCGQVRLLSPVSQHFEAKTGSQPVFHHSCVIEGSCKDGEKLEFVILGDDSVESPTYSHNFYYKPLIDKFTVDGGVVNAFFEVSTSKATTCTLMVQSDLKSGAPLSNNMVSVAQTKQTSGIQCLFFASTVHGMTHSFSVSALPSGKAYVAQIKVTCPPELAGAATINEHSQKRFSTKEPEFSDFFVTASGKELSGTPLVTDNELIFTSDDGSLYSLSFSTGKLLWQVFAGAPVAGSPVIQKGTIILNLVDGTVLGINQTDGKVLWSKATSFNWSQTPVLQGNDSMALVSDKGRISLWSIGDKKEKSFVETGKEVQCSPLAADGYLYVADTLGFLTCMDGVTGRQQWTYRTGNKLIATPGVWGKYLFLPAMDGNFYSIYRNRGVVSWRKQFGNMRAPVALVTEAGSLPNQSDVNILYFIAVSKNLTRLVKLNTNGGATLWDVPVERNLQGTPFVSEGRIYVAGTNGLVCCFSARDGMKLWSVDTGGEIRGNPVVADGDLFVANYKGSIVRIRD